MQAQARNSREAITGVMLYDDRRFFQWLEGPNDSVGRVMHSIRNDPRHTEIEVLDDKAARERTFADWSMKLATRGPAAVTWRDAMLEPPADVVDDLRQRPDAAPAVLIKLAPRPATHPASGAARIDHLPLGKATTAILKNVILASVIPELAGQHGVGVPAVHPRASELAELLVAADQGAARELIDELHAAEGTVWPLYAAVFEPAARSLGDLWAEDFCSEFEVTLGLCRMQSAARLLSAHAPQKALHRLPAGAVLIAPEPGELHQLGAVLESEVLWNAGWAPRCEYPADDKSLQDLVSGTWFDALDVSLSAAFQREDWLPRLTKTIEAARRASRNPALLVVVGGRIFVDHKTSGAEVGADLTSLTSVDVEGLIRGGIAVRDADAQPAKRRS
jgi:methanogenic corrinoid protein MtbC1